MYRYSAFCGIRKVGIGIEGVITKRILVYGIVQGVGFRPTVSRHAMATGIGGTVCNKGPYVEIFAQGTQAQVEAFLKALEQQPPKRAAILKLEVRPCATETLYDGFAIIESEKTKGEIFVSPDIAICEECKKELYAPQDRRYLHPFINCTCCGPRLTILDALPYDRERTSMKAFPMCPDCASEYYDPETRRYDAQPVCCNHCGPEVYLLDRPERGSAAITEARRTILAGGIVAVKGIGGFHLCCDAGNEEAVRLLRQRKSRPMKPFAVMMRNEAVAARECHIEQAQREVLTGHQKPIVLLRRRPESTIAPSVAPDNPKIGVMLPYAPVQLLLFDYDDGLQMPDYLVMTSGNVSGAPICRDDNDARQELARFSDCILSHDRRIRIRADDSVMDFYQGKPYMIRRSRGYAPLPVMISEESGQVLAIGGELKNTFCVGSGSLLYPSPYVGDLADLRTVKALEETIQRFETLLELTPEVVACDLHPKYNSTLVAQQQGIPLLPVQHHYAHVLSCMAENDWRDRVIGLSLDGTGYGSDGTIWGGEILLSDLVGFQRMGSIVPFRQVGGDASAKEGWRIAVSLLYSLLGDREQTLSVVEQLALTDRKNATVLMNMADLGINTVTSTSAGRLFDGISAILGIRKVSTFEGEASTALQFAAERYRETGSPLPAYNGALLKEGADRLLLATDALTAEILHRRQQGESCEALAYLFHEGLSRQLQEICRRLREETGCDTVALSGGCYQNLLLLELTEKKLEADGFRVLTHSLVPPNDGGLCLGQAYYAMAELKRKNNKN